MKLIIEGTSNTDVLRFEDMGESQLCRITIRGADGTKVSIIIRKDDIIRLAKAIA